MSELLPGEGSGEVTRRVGAAPGGRAPAGGAGVFLQTPDRGEFTSKKLFEQVQNSAAASAPRPGDLSDDYDFVAELVDDDQAPADDGPEARSANEQLGVTADSWPPEAAERVAGLDGDEAVPEEEPVAGLEDEDVDATASAPRLQGGHIPRQRQRRQRQRVDRRLKAVMAAPRVETAAKLTAQQRLLLLDTWQRSGLPAGDFAAMVGLSKHTLYNWKKKFDSEGPSGLVDRPSGGPRGSRLCDLTRRTILMLKQSNPDWGCQRISDMLVRGPALPASPQAVARVLTEAGYKLSEEPTHPHPDKVRRFERARPNQLWQTDLFTFILKRQNRRVYLVAFMDDHSRFIVGYGLHASQSSALVLEVLRAGLTNFETPQEILTDNGSQYVTWRGKSAFTRELEKRGIKQVVARPRHPQTLGKIERFWGTLWQECIQAAVFLDMGDAQRRIGLFIDHYNFQRPHQGIDGLVPADRFFGAAEEVKRTLAARVAANALELARHGVPKEPLYLTGQVGGQPVSLHAEGERVILTGPTGERQEVDLAARRQPLTPVAGQSGSAEATVPPSPPLRGRGVGGEGVARLPEPLCPVGVVNSQLPDDAERTPGTSPLDEDLCRLEEEFGRQEGGQP